jgi:putative (di)nucleoside polyphosphate hydrolase
LPRRFAPRNDGNEGVTDAGYRPGVGVMLLNDARQVWVGQRLDSTLEAWQMPQGGLEPGEAPLEGALRELEEETGIGPHLIEIITRAPEELTYDLPEDLIGKIWKKPWRGQRQTWFLARFLGRDGDVDIATAHPEFRAWKWADPREIPGLIVPFKKELYEQLIKAFEEWL